MGFGTLRTPPLKCGLSPTILHFTPLIPYLEISSVRYLFIIKPHKRYQIRVLRGISEGIKPGYMKYLQPLIALLTIRMRVFFRIFRALNVSVYPL